MGPSPVVAAVPVFTWSGFYSGIHGGYIGHESDATLVGVGGVASVIGAGAFAPTGLDSGFGFDSEGLMFGGQIGGNVQFGMFVAGIEADISYTDVGERDAFALGRVTTYRSDMDYFGTVRGRLGLAFDRFMIYGTGGLAYAGLDNRVTSTPPGGVGVTFSGRNDSTEIGYTVGAGIEYAINNNVTLKGEYLYYDFGRRTVRVVGDTGVAADFLDVRFRDDGHISRVGVNVKF
jgi:outer membrane immunogenic protein